MQHGSNGSTEYIYRDALSLPAATDLFQRGGPPSDVFIEPPGVVRSFRRQQPEFLADPDNVGLFDQLPPGVFSSPPSFVARSKNARILGFRTVLSNDGFFFNDDSVSGDERQEIFLATLSQPDPLNEETGLQRLGGSDSFLLNLRDRPVQHLPGTTVLLSSAEPSNYGSWLFRVLPKLQTLKRLRMNGDVKFLVWAGTPTFQEYLNILGVAEGQLIQHDPKNVVYQLEEAIVPSIRNNQAFLDAESVALYSQLREELGEAQLPGHKIYISRLAQSRRGSTRAMKNEAELIERLRAIGFRIINPEGLSVPEQVRTFSSAEMVVGPSGSGMFNVVFCHPGTKVIDIESEPHWIHAHLCLFTSCSLRYGIFVGKCIDKDFTTHHKSWNVNIDALLDRINDF